MKINGIERKLCMTVEAACKIAEMTPTGRIQDIGSLYDGKSTRETIETTKRLAVIMSEGYCDRMRFEHPGQSIPEPLTMEDFQPTMTMAEYNRFDIEVAKALKEGMAAEVETEDDGKNAAKPR